MKPWSLVEDGPEHLRCLQHVSICNICNMTLHPFKKLIVAVFLSGAIFRVHHMLTSGAETGAVKRQRLQRREESQRRKVPIKWQWLGFTRITTSQHSAYLF